MTFRKASEDTHQGCRSLLQKAVRRGNRDLVRKVVKHLSDIGDKAWLRQRCVVITLEECWPLFQSYTYSSDLLDIADHLCLVSSCVKNKNAAGLGALAYALSEGDQTVLRYDHRDKPVQIIASAIQRTEDYWNWLLNKCDRVDQTNQVMKLKELHKKNGWPWDKAFVLAAGYLYLEDTVPPIHSSRTISTGEFPFVVALDRHTEKGKNAIREAARKLGLPVNQVSWMSFYCESAHTDQCQPAQWWEREQEWRLGKVGLTVSKAHDLWRQVRPILKEILEPEIRELKSHIEETRPTDQLRLF
jgi:hypothetical protein